MEEADVKNLIKDHLDQRELDNQFDVSPIPYHTHNGTDSPLVQGSTSKNARSTGTGVTTIATGTYTQLTLNTNDYKNGVTWDSTNYRLTILTAGQYLVTGQTTYTNIAGGTQYLLEIRKNGSQVIQITQGGTAGWDLTLQGTDILNLKSTDYLELWTRQNSGGNQTVANSTLTHLSIAKV